MSGWSRVKWLGHNERQRMEDLDGQTGLFVNCSLLGEDGTKGAWWGRQGGSGKGGSRYKHTCS